MLLQAIAAGRTCCCAVPSMGGIWNELPLVTVELVLGSGTTVLVTQVRSSSKLCNMCPCWLIQYLTVWSTDLPVMCLLLTSQLWVGFVLLMKRTLVSVVWMISLLQ